MSPEDVILKAWRPAGFDTDRHDVRRILDAVAEAIANPDTRYDILDRLGLEPCRYDSLGNVLAWEVPT